ncbi:MAG TPA: SPOR domain-containing protein [Spirochaetota bacterium]|jgi:hypothetical protein|nr:SPOR domain-containing protein [Spirochaetota bacterium]HQO22128.1 SPOR domain-containing protein [Spirochaetota bacterium]HQQ23928.1 SPOR domain-containing protein [Spirochaetota bacterium]
MQDFDLYVKKQGGYSPAYFENPDIEYHSRGAEVIKNNEKKHGNFNRTLTIAAALCIISFTAGMVVGIKFTGDPNKPIVDEKTMQAVNELKSLVSKNPDQIQSTSDVYPKEEYPFAVKINETMSLDDSKKAADALSKRGHTVILAKNGEDYNLFIGPFKTMENAESSLQKIREYKEYAFCRNSVVIKRI